MIKLNSPFKIPKKLWERVDKIERWGEETDEPKYMIFFAEGWLWDEFSNWGVDTQKEAIEIIRDAEKIDLDSLSESARKSIAVKWR